MQEPTLVLLAAGLSKRFGRSKQETPVGPDGEVLHDYNIYDALSSGFGRIAFVVRSDNEAAIRDAFEARFGYSVPTSYVRQMRPLGTGHAVAGIRGVVEGPFAVCNTDDLYGREAFGAVLERLRDTRAGMPIQGCAVGYRLDATLSEHGGVARAVCRVDEAGRFVGIDEILDIQRDGGGALVGRTPEGEPVALTGEERVSMNLWGFGPGMAEALMQQYEKWTYEGAREEYRLSSAVDHMVKKNLMEIDVLPGPDEAWMGMTHAADIHVLREVLEKAVESGRYPTSLRAAFRG